ncbi:hypothetical protein SAMN05444350_12342 [Bacteroides stercorirosoris]|uniref:Uncharacterized protein n=1 Tax=Bacteroides stercorirosoris TaxID=871324 RepID=A0A1M6IIW0_9BACE|nr:hypothetical protein SAMN05444350_12342 [Bacteroides stercorirosoris]
MKSFVAFYNLNSGSWNSFSSATSAQRQKEKKVYG